MSGGGGGTYGVVWSLTSKAQQDSVRVGANLTFTSANILRNTYYKGIEAYHASLPGIVDTGVMSVWSFTNSSFSINSVTGPNMTAAQLRATLKHFLGKLASLNIKYDLFIKDSPTYLEEYNQIQRLVVSGNSIGIAQYGGWLISRSVIDNDNQALTSAIRNITTGNTLVIGVGLNASKKIAGDVYNAVLPAWREALIELVVTT